MNPTGMLPPDQQGLCRYFERFGGFSRQKELGMIVWQASQAFDMLQQGDTLGARDVLALLLVYLDQACLDNGNTTVAWLLSLQSDPPRSLFQDSMSMPGSSVQAFSPLAEQRWVTTALSFLKEVDLISSRRAEIRQKPSPAES